MIFLPPEDIGVMISQNHRIGVLGFKRRRGSIVELLFRHRRRSGDEIANSMTGMAVYVPIAKVESGIAQTGRSLEI